MILPELLDKLPVLSLERVQEFSCPTRHDLVLRIVYHVEIEWTNPPMCDHLQFDISMN